MNDVTRVGPRSGLHRFVPRIVTAWPTSDRFTTVEGTLCFVDISGFTALSEKLAARGRVGAEELTDVLDRVFGDMLRLAYERGGSLLKFGGDALLLLFLGDEHPQQAAAAAIEMRSALRSASDVPTSVGRIRLRMSVGLETGPVDLFLVGSTHRELIITGPTATATTEMEKAAEAGQIIVGPRLSDELCGMLNVERLGQGSLVRSRRATLATVGPSPRHSRGDELVASFVPVGLRAHLGGRVASEPEHRSASVAFLQFRGVDQLLASKGHAAVAAALDSVVAATQRAADEEGVTFLGTDIDQDGGKIIIVSGVPTTNEDDEGRILRAARRIIEADPELPVRIGVNRGHVFAGEIGTDFRATFTIMGDTVNLAARLMSNAPFGGALATGGVIGRSRTLFDTTPVEPFHVKGKREPIHAMVVGPETGTRVAHERGDLAFAGRGEELARLTGAIAGLADGGGTSLTVLGDAGIGKSRLVSEALSRTPPPARVIITAEPNGVDIPYWAFRDPLRRELGIERRSQSEMVADLDRVLAETAPDLRSLAPLIGDALHIDAPENDETSTIEPRFRPARVAAAVNRLFESRFPDGLVLVAEDAHWLDDASASLVEAIRDRCNDLPWLLIATSRERIPGNDPSLIRIGPLPLDVVERLIVEATQSAPLRPDEIAQIARRAGGNPLFLGEILRVVRETGRTTDLPDSLDAVVGAQIDALPELPRRLLRYSSVLGRSFRRSLLDRFLEPEEVEMDEATTRAIARFVTEDGPDRWRFRHAVLRDVAYQGLSYRRRRELHARAAAVIEELAGDDLEAVVEFLALHHAAAGNQREAWRYSVIAGRRAADAYVNLEAAGHFERAIDAGRRIADLSPDELAEIWTALGNVREAAGLYDAALDAFRSAMRLRVEPVRRAELNLKRARVRARVGSYRPAFRDITLGEQLLDGTSDDEALAMRARLRALRAQLRQLQERPHAAIELAREAASSAEAAGELRALAQALQVLDASYNMAGQPSLAVHGDRTLQLFQQLGDLTSIANVTNNLGGRAYFEGDWRAAIDHYEAAEAAFRRAGNEAEAATSRANIAEVLVSQRRYDEAEELLAGAVRVLRAHQLVDAALFAEIQLARLRAGQARHEEAEELLIAIRSEATDVGQVHSALEAAIHLAEELARRGEPLAALGLLDQATDDAGDDAALFATMIARVRADALMDLGEIDTAEEAVAAGLEQARSEQLRYDEALLLTVEARLARARGDEGRTAAADEAATEILQMLGVT